MGSNAQSVVRIVKQSWVSDLFVSYMWHFCSIIANPIWFLLFVWDDLSLDWSHGFARSLATFEEGVWGTLMAFF